MADPTPAGALRGLRSVTPLLFGVALSLCGCKQKGAAPSEKAGAPAAVAGAAGEPALDPSDPKKLMAAVDRMAGQLKDKPKSFEVLAALGNLYYENGRYLEAVDSFRLALEKAATVETEAQALRAKGVKPAAEVPLECRRSGPSYGLEQIAAAGRLLGANDPGKALRCDQEALSMVAVTRSRRGNALYLVGQPDGALAEHKRVLESEPDFPESLFFVGAITLEQSQGDKQKLEEGKKYWRRLLEVAPDHARAALVRESLPKADEMFARKLGPDAGVQPSALAGGQVPPSSGHLPLDAPAGPAAVAGNQPGAPLAHGGAASNELPPAAQPSLAPRRPSAEPSPEAIRSLAEAAAQTERTPELEKGLDDLTAKAEKALDEGRGQEARDAIVRVMPMRPQDARTAAVMGGAMRALGRAEMAERVLGRALELDPKQPRALYELGKLQAARGDKAGARNSFQAALAADAKFADAHQLPAELAKLR